MTTEFCIAQLNLGYLKYDRFAKEMHSYQNQLEIVMELALNDPGLLWIHEDHTIEKVEKIWGKKAAANLSTWINVEHLRSFMFTKLHMQVMERSDDWFIPQKEETFVMWYSPIGSKPSLEEAYDRLEYFRFNGQSEYAFNDLFNYPKSPNI